MAGLRSRVMQLLFLMLTAILIVSGCAFFSNSSAALLWTNRPEMVAYVELFNAEQADYRLEIKYVETPWRDLLETAQPPDLVVGIRLESSNVIRSFTPLDRLLNSGRLDAEAFYPQLLHLGASDENQLLLPLSFDLPAVMFPADSPLMADRGLKITPAELRSIGGQWNVSDNGFERMGLSPGWQPALAYEISRLFGASYHETSLGITTWQQSSLDDALTYMRDWIDEVNGGPEREQEFRHAYLFDPYYKLIRQGRVLFAHVTANEYITIPAEIREDLDIVWLGDEEKILVVDSVVFIGRPKQSVNRRAAEAFIQWIFNPDTQIKLLHTAQLQRMRTFGITGGFSAITSVNRDVLPTFYPFLFGRVPATADLRFPPVLPAEWDLMKHGAVLPWIQEALVSEPETDSAGLSARLRRWRLQQPVFR